MDIRLKRITFTPINTSYMSKPKSTYSFRLSDASVKKLQYCGHKLRPKGQKTSHLTNDLERVIDRLYDFYKDGAPLFEE